MSSDLLSRRRDHFVLWRPAHTEPTPSVVLGPIEGSVLGELRTIPLAPLDDHPDLFGVAARTCDLRDNTMYGYWFQIQDSDPYLAETRLCLCTDPFATAVDRRFPAPGSEEVAGGQPAGLVYHTRGQLVPCDADGTPVTGVHGDDMTRLPSNNRLVIYELPARWVHSRTLGSATIGDGTFRDVTALLHGEGTEDAVIDGTPYLSALGITALELLPPADSTSRLGWGYGTANFFAADYYLGYANPETASTASSDLSRVIDTAHRQGIRFFSDMVMAFARDCPLRNVNYPDFFIQYGSGDPEQGTRESFGGDLFKFAYFTDSYDPLSGERHRISPSRAFLQIYLEWWMTWYRVDGLRLDSVNNIANQDFLGEFRARARALWHERGGSDDRFLVVGEELSVPVGLVGSHRLDGLWNETFKHIARQVLLGRSWEGAPDFIESVHTLIDCRRLGFSDEAQAVNYLTSHDIGGYGNERLCDWLLSNGVAEIEERAKLAFVCLLTAVGLPMILAGDEFAEQQDLDIVHSERADVNKEVDPVNFGRLRDDWRRRLFLYVSRLIHLRTASGALGTNEVAFIHAEETGDRRVIAWQRDQGNDLVVVVANFSDYGTPAAEDGPGEYQIAGWPRPEDGRHWYDVGEDRPVSDEWAGREPLRPWTAYVYARREG